MADEIQAAGRNTPFFYVLGDDRVWIGDLGAYFIMVKKVDFPTEFPVQITLFCK